MPEPVFGPAFGEAPPPPFRLLAKRRPGDLARILVLKNDIPLAVKENAEYITSCSGCRIVWRREVGEWTRTADGWFDGWECVYRDAGRRAEYRSGSFRIVLDIKKTDMDR